jgi:hypothetical protein
MRGRQPVTDLQHLCRPQRAVQRSVPLAGGMAGDVRLIAQDECCERAEFRLAALPTSGVPILAN